MGNETASFLRTNFQVSQDELQSFRTWLTWLCVDQSNCYSSALSWLMFVSLVVVVPCVSHFLLACADCDISHTRPYDGVVQLSLSSVATLSFVCLARFVSKYGLRSFLFFDKLCDESETIRKCYIDQLNRSLKILFFFVLPCFTAEAAYKIWWYASGGSRIPFLGNVYVSNSVACIMELCSWLYRTVVFFLVCVLFRLICYLQILRLQDFTLVFQAESDVESVLREHLRIRRYLRIISHRYRAFILWALVFVTVSLLASLLKTTKTGAELSIYKAGELALCSVSLLAGLMILLRSAARITHKAQSVTSLAAKWHVCATVESFESAENDNPNTEIESARVFPISIDGSSDDEDVDDGEDQLNNSEVILAYAYSAISFQKRQALVSYFENNRAGITVYGFMLDRGSLNTIFGVELTLVLWLLGKTIVSV